MSHADKWQKQKDSLGPRIVELRTKQGMSMGQLAEVIGVSRSYLHELEHGVSRAPSVFIAHDIAQALGVSLEFLIGMTGKCRGVPSQSSELIQLKRRLARVRNLLKDIYDE